MRGRCFYLSACSSAKRRILDSKAAVRPMSSHHCPSNAAEDGTTAVAAAPASSALATPAGGCVWTSCVRTGTTSLSDAAPACAAVIAADVGGGVAASAGTGAAGGGMSVCTATLADGGGGAADGGDDRVYHRGVHGAGGDGLAIATSVAASAIRSSSKGN